MRNAAHQTRVNRTITIDVHNTVTYCLAALNLGTGPLTTRGLEQPARRPITTGHRKQQRLQGACAAHLQDIARL